MTGVTRSWPDAVLTRVQTGREIVVGVARVLPRGTAAVAAITALAALLLPAGALGSLSMLWLGGTGVLLAGGAVFAAIEGRHGWLTPLPSIAAVSVTAGTILVNPSEGVLMVGLVAVLIAVHLVALDLIAARTGLRGFRAEGGALLAAFGATAVTVLVAQLPALQWLWLAGVGLAAATAAFVMVIGQRR